MTKSQLIVFLVGFGGWAYVLWKFVIEPGIKEKIEMKEHPERFQRSILDGKLYRHLPY